MKITAQLTRYVEDVIHADVPEAMAERNAFIRGFEACGYDVTHIDGKEYLGICPKCQQLAVYEGQPGRLCIDCHQKADDCKKTDRYEAAQLPSVEDCTG